LSPPLVTPVESGQGVVVVIPTYDEAANIDEVVRSVRAALAEATILVVDDASPDGTGDLAEALGAELGKIEVLRRTGKNGLGSAYREGFAWAVERGASIVVQMDADLSHDPSALGALVVAVRYGADLALGSRYVPGGEIRDWPYRRHFLSRWGNRYVAAMLGLAVNDATSGYRAWSVDALGRIDAIHLESEGYAFQVELTLRIVRSGGRVVEIPITFVDRQRGESKLSRHIVGEALWLVTRWAFADLRGRFRRTRRN
jgi:dolichol-phosphate mannosyltransferase